MSDPHFTPEQAAAESAEKESVACGGVLSSSDQHEADESLVANHRVMTMTPLEPREMNGLRGFGFTVSWAGPSNPGKVRA